MAVEDVFLEDVKIIKPNFSGEERLYNAAGQRNFLIVVPDEAVETLLKDGWSIKQLKRREGMPEDEEPSWILKVSLKVDGRRPPRVELIAGRKRASLNEETIDILDYVAIQSADLVIRPYHHEDRHSGTKNPKATAWLKHLVVHQRLDPIDEKYIEEDYEEMTVGGVANVIEEAETL